MISQILSLLIGVKSGHCSCFNGSLLCLHPLQWYLRPRSDDGRLPTVVDNEVIGHLKSKLEEAEDALRVADREAQTLHQQLQEAEKRVLAAERAADAAAAAVDEAVALAVEVARAEGKEVR